MKAAVVVGVGTSGLRILENLQQFMYEAYKDRMMIQAEESGVALLNIETDADVVPRETPVGSLIKGERCIKATVQNIIAACNELKHKDVDISWFDPHLVEPFASPSIIKGAGHYRAIGRLALWERENFGTVYQTLDTLYETVLPKVMIKEKPLFIVTGSLMGGTCSGAFIDLAYMARHISGNKGQYTGLFLLPQEGLGKEGHRVYANTWASLQDLVHFSNRKDYRYTWPNGITYEADSAPFEDAYLISTQYSKNAPVHRLADYSDLFYLGGYYLFCYLCGLVSDINAQHINAPIGPPLLSFGFSGVSYPRYSLAECAACDLSLELINHLTDESSYHDPKGERVSINPAEVIKEAGKFLDDLLSEELRQFEVLGSDKLREMVPKKAREWENNKDNEKLRAPFAYAPGTGNLYDLMDGKREDLTRTVAGRILRRQVELLTETENLSYLENFNHGLEHYRNKTMALWELQGITKDLAKFNTALGHEPADRLVCLWDFDARAGNEESVWRLTDKVRLFIMAKILYSLDFLGSVTTDSPFFTNMDLQAIRKGLVQGDNSAREKIQKRRGELERILSDNTLPIKMVWNKGSLSADMAWAKDHILTSYKSLDRGEKIDSFLRDFRLREDMTPERKNKWANLISSFQEKIIARLDQQEVMRVIKQRLLNPDIEIDHVAERARHVLLPLEVGGTKVGDSKGVPSLMLHDDAPLLDSLRHRVPKGFKRNSIWPEFSHALLFYQEQLHLDPLNDLQHRKDMATYLEKPEVIKQSGKPFLESVWNSAMDPYEVEKRKTRPQANLVAEVLYHVAIAWETDPDSGLLQPIGSYLDGLKVLPQEGSVRFQAGGEQIEVAVASHPALLPALEKALVGNRNFLLEATTLLKAWQPGKVLEKQRDRWDQMEYQTQQINEMQQRYQKLATLLETY